MNISLPDALKSFVDEQVSSRGYGTSSEYMRELIRKDQDRQRLRRLVLEGAGSPPAASADTAFFDGLRARAGTRDGVRQKRIVPRERANRDADEAIDYYVAEAGDKVALGFIDALEQAYRHMARHPATGSSRYGHELDLPGLRCWSLKRYPYPIFFVERDDPIDVWRILHAERDVPAWMHEPHDT